MKAGMTSLPRHLIIDIPSYTKPLRSDELLDVLEAYLLSFKARAASYYR